MLTLTLKDVGLDLIKLETANLMNKLFYQRGLVEHQVLLTIISLAVDVNSTSMPSQGDRIFNVPLTTLAGKTCVLSRYMKTLRGMPNDDPGAAVANIVITSPSIDLGQNHLQLLLALFRGQGKVKAEFFTPPPSPLPSPGRSFLSRIELPRIAINLSVHEPSFRILVSSTTSISPRMLVWNISNLLFEVQASTSLDSGFYQVESTTKFGGSAIQLWESDGKQLPIFRSGSCEMKVFMKSIMTGMVECDVYLESILLEINRTEIIDSARKIFQIARFDLEPDRLRRGKRSLTFEDVFPAWVKRMTFEGRELNFVVAGVDDQLSPEIRGTAVEFQNWMLDYQQEHHLGHKHSARGHQKAAFEARHVRLFAVESRERWDRTHPILDTPDVLVSVSLHHAKVQDEMHLTAIIPDCLLGFSLFKLYVMFLSFKTLQSIFKKPPGIVQHERRRRSSSASSMENDVWTQYARRQCLVLDIRSDLIRLKTQLPEDQIYMFEAEDVHVSRESFPGAIPYIRASFVRLHTRSPIISDAWDRVVSIRGLKLERRDQVRHIDTEALVPAQYILRTEAIRFRIPYQFILHRMIDSLKNAFKSGKQLIYRFTHDFCSDFIISPQAEPAKRIPRIRIKSKCVMLDLEDDPFEARLGFIYRVGATECAARQARDIAFEAKVETLRKLGHTQPINHDFEAEGTEGMERKKKNRRSRFRRSAAVKTQPPAEESMTHERRKSMRYEPDKAATLSTEAEISIEAAREKLEEHNSEAWIRRFNWAKQERAKRMESIREQIWGDDEISHLLQSHERILPLPSRPALFSIHLSSVDITLDEPSCGYDQLPEFLHRTGGLPMDTQFTLLIPFHIKWTMNELRIHLRDYPLPFIHIPPVHHSQHQSAVSRLPAWSFETDIVLAEELRGEDSTFHSDTLIIPKDHGHKGCPAFLISVPRTLNSVKFYSSIAVEINSAMPTKLVWGTSYQSALHDAMQVFDAFTKPTLDPSDKIGFWDKMRLIVHSDFTFHWKGGGDVHLTLKGTCLCAWVTIGSRNPYVVIGDGAGFMFCWRGNVVWKIATEENPRDLSHVDSEEFILAIPDFTSEPLVTDDYTDHENSFQKTRNLSLVRLSRNAIFGKVIMKLNGRVRWIAGLVLEGRCEHGCADCDGNLKCRKFQFIPHYEVVLKKPEFCHSTEAEV
jgi:Fmp27/BLTP2/Hobbit, GFWDK motif-containg RBG unit/FMP27, sixth RBG unit/FMP27/BTLP1, N-terminal/Fmp27, SW motif RBG repeat